jgi:hypothetical protein
MKAYRNRVLTIAALALVSIGASPAPATAQAAAQGKFTLPYAVTWQGVVVPAGDYTFTLMPGAVPARLILRGPNGSMFIGAMAMTPEHYTNGKSSLTVERRGGALFVREMDLAFLNRVIRFRLPKVSKEEVARGPAATEQILVAMAR